MTNMIRSVDDAPIWKPTLPPSIRTVPGADAIYSLLGISTDNPAADLEISIEKLKNGHYWLGVHIADVAHYVQEGGALEVQTGRQGPRRALVDRPLRCGHADG